MTTKQWQQLGLFAGMVGAVAFVDIPIAQKLVLAVGLVVLLVGAPKIVGVVDSVFGG
jgi:hypothetical protein